jgi:hypothetical protein
MSTSFSIYFKDLMIISGPKLLGLGMMAYTYNSNCAGGRGGKIADQGDPRSTGAKKHKNF